MTHIWMIFAAGGHVGNSVSAPSPIPYSRLDREIEKFRVYLLEY